jgi:hypothetical protein
MTASDKPAPDAAMLTRYLLGSLPAEEVEQLDELSITDEEFVARLSGVENDLVDAYVRGELAGDTVERFKRAYLSSPLRIRKVEFAQTLLMFEQRSGSAVAAVPAKNSANGPQTTSFWQRLITPSAFPAWGFVAATLAVAALYLTVENVRLHRELSHTQSEQAALTHQVEEQRAVAAAAERELQQARTSQTDLEGLKVVALLLMPPTRGVSSVPSIKVPAGTSLVVLSLALEPADFKTYRAVLRQRATQQILWRSGDLQPASSGGSQFVSISIPAHLFVKQDYVAELAGLRSNGAIVPVNSYPFNAAIQ